LTTVSIILPLWHPWGVRPLVQAARPADPPGVPPTSARTTWPRRPASAAASTIGRIERGEAIPGVETFISLAQALELEPVLVPPHIGKFLDLDTDDISAIVRAAAVAVEDETGAARPTCVAGHLALARLKARPPQQTEEVA
jgi:hypothetical protein